MIEFHFVNVRQILLFLGIPRGAREHWQISIWKGGWVDGFKTFRVPLSWMYNVFCPKIVSMQKILWQRHDCLEIFYHSNLGGEIYLYSNDPSILMITFEQSKVSFILILMYWEWHQERWGVFYSQWRRTIYLLR